MAVCSEIHTKHTSIRLTKSRKHNYSIVSQVSDKKSPHVSARRQSSGEILRHTYSKIESVLSVCLSVWLRSRIHSTAVCSCVLASVMLRSGNTQNCKIQSIQVTNNDSSGRDITVFGTLISKSNARQYTATQTDAL